MAYSKFALGDGDSDSDWGDLSSECSSDSDDSYPLKNVRVNLCTRHSTGSDSTIVET
jgi:hypothetical protein